MNFVELKRYQGALVFVNPESVLFVAGQPDGQHSEIHFSKDYHIVVSGDCKRVTNSLGQKPQA